MTCSSTLLRGGLALSLLFCLGSPSAARLSEPFDAGRVQTPVSRVMHAALYLDQRCHSSVIRQAIALIFEAGSPEHAQALAEQCAQEARAHGHADKRLISLRIQALLAMHHRDLALLHEAGQALVQQRVRLEYVPDGHMCLAFACLATGDAPCARKHLSEARAQFTALQIPQALEQLIPLEQALLSMESSDALQ